jgi:hypothetical protein
VHSTPDSSFNTGRVSSDTICRIYGQLTFSHAMMSGLEMITDAPKSMVMRQDQYPIRPLVFRLSFFPLVSTLSVKWGDEGDGASSVFFVLFLTHILNRSSSYQAVFAMSLSTVSPEMPSIPTLPAYVSPSRKFTML